MPRTAESKEKITVLARPRKFRLAALGAVLALGLSACSGAAGNETAGTPTTGSSTQNSASASVVAGLEKYYSQDVNWELCGSTIQCATIKVPLSYQDPNGESIKLALNQRVTPGATANLLVNPGGPGGSGLDFVKNSVQVLVSTDVQRQYNLVGFDPRGVGKSTPITCQSDAETDEGRQENLRAWVAADRDKIEKESTEYADQCAANTGDLLGNVDTVSAAKDMDIIRAVLGDAQLNYLGYSYGTFLGATYADLFAQNVGRFVLDGAMDPKATAEELTLGQAKGFEGEIEAWLEHCLAGTDCPFTGSVAEAKTQLQDFLAQVETQPMVASDGRTVPIIDFVNGFILPLYSQSSWDYLTQAMANAMNGDVDLILSFADQSADRGDDGSYTSNSTNAFVSINCLDRPMDSTQEAMDQDAQRLEDTSPTLGKYLAYGELTCDAWDYAATGKPEALDAAGSNDILVVGTTGDPATPYEWAQSLAGQLENGTLLTYDGHGHTAYGSSNQCITDAVDGYLLDGTMPEENTVC